MSDRTALAYRPDIDGLRALAVIGVLAYHAFPNTLSGGFAGVDVFFVISGFLITSIIARDVAEQRFSLLDFYARRIKRLFPALILVLAATALAGWFYLLPHEYRALGRHIAAGAAYVINFTLKRESGYFDADADEKPLLHLWSLAVEEQYYLLWPLVMMMVVPRRYLLPLVALIFAGSFASNMMRVVSNNAAAFFLPQNRFWELAMGAMLALAAVPSYPLAERGAAGARALAFLQRVRAPAPWARDALSLAGLALIAIAYFGLNARLHYPGAWALIPCMGAVLLIAAGPQGVVNRMVLTNPAAVAIGLISYPLYLWHWPLLSFQSILGIESTLARLGALAAAAVLATATYLFAERPLRHARRVSVPIALFAVAMAFVPLGLLARTQALPPRLSAPQFADISAATRDWEFLPNSARIPAPGGADVRKAGQGPRGVLFFGDSNIQQYWPRVEKLLAHGVPATAYFATAQGCAPIAGVRERFHPACANFAENVERFALAQGIGTVVIGAAWTGYFRDRRYIIEGKNGGSIFPGTPGYEKAVSELAAMIGRWRSKGKDVWLVLAIPAGGTLSPSSTLARSASGGVTLLPSGVNRATLDKSSGPIRERLIAIAAATGARIIDPLESLCGSEQCPGQTAGGTFIYKDPSHLRAAFVRDHAAFIDPPLTDSGTARP